MITKWHRRFFDLAKTVSTWSKDPSSQVGAVIVSQDRRNITVGYNGFPCKIKDSTKRLNNKGLKNNLMIHAELNALHNAKVSVQGSTMYVTKPPCSKCALSIIQARIVTLVIPKLSTDSSWLKEHELAIELFNEAQVFIEWIEQ